MKIASNGGQPVVHSLPYDKPVGPTSQSHEAPGLGGDNYGNGQQPICREHLYGSPGIGGTNHGNKGSQK